MSLGNLSAGGRYLMGKTDGEGRGMLAAWNNAEDMDHRTMNKIERVNDDDDYDL